MFVIEISYSWNAFVLPYYLSKSRFLNHTTRSVSNAELESSGTISLQHRVGTREELTQWPSLLLRVLSSRKGQEALYSENDEHQAGLLCGD